MIATLSFTDSTITPSINILTLGDGDGRRFAVLELGDARLILPGVDGEAAVFLRRLADALAVAADAMEKQAQV